MCVGGGEGGVNAYYWRQVTAVKTKFCLVRMETS